jgi:hypothetical protein
MMGAIFMPRKKERNLMKKVMKMAAVTEKTFKEGCDY